VSTKNKVAATTLVAAIPAGVLVFFLVATFLGKLEALRAHTAIMSLYAVTLAASAAVVFLPFGVLIFGPKGAPKDKSSTGSSDGSKSLPEEKAKAEGAEAAAATGLEEEEGEAPMGSTGDLDIVDIDPTFDESEVVDVEEEHAGGDAVDTFGDDFSFEDEPPPTPKKKKK
jgi:hypothetical protein